MKRTEVVKKKLRKKRKKIWLLWQASGLTLFLLLGASQSWVQSIQKPGQEVNSIPWEKRKRGTRCSSEAGKEPRRPLSAPAISHTTSHTLQPPLLTTDTALRVKLTLQSCFSQGALVTLGPFTVPECISTPCDSNEWRPCNIYFSKAALTSSLPYLTKTLVFKMVTSGASIKKASTYTVDKLPTSWVLLEQQLLSPQMSASTFLFSARLVKIYNTVCSSLTLSTWLQRPDNSTNLLSSIPHTHYSITMTTAKTSP